MKSITSLLCGILFGFGLSYSRMINPKKVLNFMDVTGTWDPTLGFVFLGALGCATLGYYWITKVRYSPFLDNEFHIPQNNKITTRLIAGSVIFGVGWGLVGFCPGPAMASMIYGHLKSFLFVFAMIVGVVTYKLTFNVEDQLKLDEDDN